MGTQAPRDQLSSEEHRAKLFELLRRARAVMLLTRGGAEDRIAGQPMAVARVEPDATLYLITSLDASRAAALARDPRVTVSVQDSSGFVVVDGDARIARDRALLDQLWSDAWAAWFPAGKADPDLALLVIEPREGTYWNQSFGHGPSYLYRMAPAHLTGEPLGPDDTLRARDLRSRH